MAIVSDKRPFPCVACGMPAGYVTDTGLEWQSRHNGETHWNRTTPGELQGMIAMRHEWYANVSGIYHNCVTWDKRRTCEMIGRGKWRCPICGKVWDLIPEGE